MAGFGKRHGWAAAETRHGRRDGPSAQHGKYPGWRLVRWGRFLILFSMFGISTTLRTPGIRRAALLGLGIALSFTVQAASSVALEAVRRLKGTDLSANPSLRQAVEKVAREIRGEPEHLELVRDFQLTGELPAVAEFVAARPADPAALDGVRLLLTPESRPLLEKALEKSGDRPRLLELLGQCGSREAVPLLKGWAMGPGVGDRDL